MTNDKRQMNEEIINKIKKLKIEREAVILAHNYQIDEVQDIADFVGDSLELSIQASKTKAKVIVFCGVHFMAETAAILSPDKTVIMPEIKAGCPMANMINAKALKEIKAQNSKAKVVCYVNTSAEVKAESDICCTSANAAKVVDSLDCDEIIFVPDKYLGQYTATQIKKKKKIIYWNGYCHVHAGILPQHINKQKQVYPQAEVIVHPECTPETIALADKVLSTSGMLRYVKESKAKEFILGTEIGILHRLRKENPDKKFYAASESAICPNMKLTTLEKVLWSLEDLKTKVVVAPNIADKARLAIERMIAIGRQD